MDEGAETCLADPVGPFPVRQSWRAQICPRARKLDLTRDPAGRPLQSKFRFAYEYSDCWVEDSRLVALNARDAALRGARIMTQTRVTLASRHGDLWEVVTEGPAGRQVHHARALVNAGGPWVEDVVRNVVHLDTNESVRLVRGSHIVTRKLYDHDRCYMMKERHKVLFIVQNINKENIRPEPMGPRLPRNILVLSLLKTGLLGLETLISLFTQEPTDTTANFMLNPSIFDPTEFKSWLSSDFSVYFLRNLKSNT